MKERKMKKKKEQGRIHGYISRVRLGRGSNESLQALKHQNTRSKLDVTDQQTNRPTNQPTRVAYRVACVQLKTAQQDMVILLVIFVG